MGWFKRGRSARVRRRLPRRELAPVADIIEQGMLVADVAVRMSVKNDIIMNALKRHVDYDEQQIVDMVREAVVNLADERRHDAEYVHQVRDEVRERGRSSWMDSDYDNNDGRTLRHREEVYEGVSQQLRERADDEEYLRRTAERARLAAWAEIGDSLKERASHPHYGGGHTEEYAQARESRIQQLIEKDLTALVMQHRPQPAS